MADSPLLYSRPVFTTQTYRIFGRVHAERADGHAVLRHPVRPLSLTVVQLLEPLQQALRGKALTARRKQ